MNEPIERPAPVVDVITNGINSWPGLDDAWTDRYVTWTLLHTENKVQAFEYYARTLTRRWFSNQDDRADKLTRLLTWFVDAGFRIRLVGHSNGCDVILRALHQLPDLANRPVVDEVHFFNGAVESDFEKNGLNKMLAQSKIWKVFVYVGGKDNAMVVANYLPGFYGDLGFKGPLNVSTAVPLAVLDQDAPLDLNARLIMRIYPGFHHSSFFEQGDNFEATMRVLNVLPAIQRPVPEKTVSGEVPLADVHDPK
jgi:pimeloyl-ACP methyl ester carboxylesterase